MQLPAVRLHFFQFVEGAEQTHLDSGVLLGISERASMGFGPGGDDLTREENTDRIGQLAVGSDVEDVLVGVRLTGAGCQGGTFSDEVVLVNVALRSSVGFEATDGYEDCFKLRALGYERAGILDCSKLAARSSQRTTYCYSPAKSLSHIHSRAPGDRTYARRRAQCC